jgi:hypothetical protein
LEVGRTLVRKDISDSSISLPHPSTAFQPGSADHLSLRRGEKTVDYNMLMKGEVKPATSI